MYRTERRRSKGSPINVCSNSYKTFTPLQGRRHSKPRNGDLEFSEELTMTALLYRGHSYEAPAASPKACIELTYRRETYNTCREEVAHNAHPSLTYRGVSYAK